MAPKLKACKLFVNIPAINKQQDPQSLFIDRSKIQEIKEEGVRVRVVCGATGGTASEISTPDPLTLLHIFLESGKDFTHMLPAQWSGTVFVIEGLFDFTTDEHTIELEEGMVVSMANSDSIESLTFTGITGCQLLLISGKPLQEKLFSQGAMVMNSEEALVNTVADFKNGKMGFIEMEGEIRKVIKPV